MCEGSILKRKLLACYSEMKGEAIGIINRVFSLVGVRSAWNEMIDKCISYFFLFLQEIEGNSFRFFVH